MLASSIIDLPRHAALASRRRAALIENDILVELSLRALRGAGPPLAMKRYFDSVSSTPAPKNDALIAFILIVLPE